MPKLIESVKNPLIKDMVRLQSKKHRDRQNRFLVQGEHMIEEANSRNLIDTLFLLEGTSLPFETNGQIIYCTQAVLNHISLQQSDAKAIALVKKPEFSNEKAEKVLLLDGIQDPGNMGTLIRSAYSFGCQKVLCSKGSADPFSFKALQSSQGAIFSLPVEFCDLAQAIASLKEQQIPVLGAALEEKSVDLKELSRPEKYALIIGNEGQGISRQILDLCDSWIKIEMSHFESLNAAIAGSIILYYFQ